MILTEKLKMKVNGKMVQKYKELGFDVKQYDDIELPIIYLSEYSHQKIVCACDICGDQKEVKYNNYCAYIKRDPNNQYTCKICNLEKRKNTCTKKYGQDNVSKLNDIKIKKEKTMLNNGTDYYMNDKKFKLDMIEKYGFENPSQNEEIHKKQQSGYIKKYYNTELYYL